MSGTTRAWWVGGWALTATRVTESPFWLRLREYTTAVLFVCLHLVSVSSYNCIPFNFLLYSVCPSKFFLSISIFHPSVVCDLKALLTRHVVTLRIIPLLLVLLDKSVWHISSTRKRSVRDLNGSVYSECQGDLLDTSSWSLAKIKRLYRKHRVDICVISFANQSLSDVILCKTSF